MRRILGIGVLLYLGLASLVPPGLAAEPRKEPLVSKVEKAIERAKTFIKSRAKDGKWESETYGVSNPGGPTCLAILALLTAGATPSDPVVERALEFIRRLPPEGTYVTSLQTMVLAKAGEGQKERDKITLERNVKWLLEARRYDGGKFVGWAYHKTDQAYNNSNTQYVLLALHEALQVGIPIAAEDLKEIRQYYIDNQNRDGGWGYRPGDPQSTLTMTSAGLCGLIITGQDLNQGREKPKGDGTWENCGDYKESKEVKAALDWLAIHLPAQKDYSRVRFLNNIVLFYFLYGLERTGRLSGLRFIGDHDWYREGCEYLVESQDKEDGSWKSSGPFEHSPVVNTCFALLFLAKGRTPILISKLSHAAKIGHDKITPTDWNNDRNDVRNLVDFTSRELFKGLPMGWQIFDAKKTGSQTTEDLAAELLQSPIVYFNGHFAPQFEPTEIEMLHKYVEEGGFIFAEACCEREEFDRGFRRLVEEELFPEYKLKRLTPEHPIYRASGKFQIDPKIELWGLNYGCKTVLVYSPKDLSCQWESNQYHDKAREAFQAGANIIAYATGMEPPLPRLHESDILRDVGKEPPKGYLKVAQLKHTGDWQPARNAMPNLMREMTRRGAKVSIKTEEISFNDTNLVDFKVIYMHGRNAFDKPNKKALENLRFDLSKAGGLLIADACCGSKAFDKSFREFIKVVFDKDLEPIPLRDELFSAELNGSAIEKVRCRRESVTEKTAAVGYPTVEPALEGIKMDGRWVVIYSKWDIGCALEKHPSTDCLGHDHESAVRLASAFMLYALKR